MKDSLKSDSTIKKSNIIKPQQLNYYKKNNHNDKDEEYYSIYHNKLLTYTPEDFYTALMYEAKTIMKERHLDPDHMKYEDYTYVLSYPPYYSPEEIGVLKTIAQRSFHHEPNDVFDYLEKIPSYENVYVIPEYEAAAITYGYENNSSFSCKKNIVIIDIGYFCSYCVLCEYTRDECKIKEMNYRQNICGSIIDNMIFDYFKDRISKEEGKENFTEKEILKLRMEISKVKEKLSASGADTVQITVDGILEDDEDYSGEFSVKELNDIIKDLPNELIKLLKDTVKDTVDYDVVIIGGSLRIPLFQNALEKEIGHTLIKTMNMDESVAYGCIYYGAKQKHIWNYTITNEYENKKDMKPLLSGKWKGIRHTIDEVYIQEKESNEAARMRNNIEKNIYELQHLINTKPNKYYEEYCEELLRILKLRGFLYIPSKMLQSYENEIKNVTEKFKENTDLYIYNCIIII